MFTFTVLRLDFVVAQTAVGRVLEGKVTYMHFIKAQSRFRCNFWPILCDVWLWLSHASVREMRMRTNSSIRSTLTTFNSMRKQMTWCHSKAYRYNWIQSRNQNNWCDETPPPPQHSRIRVQRIQHFLSILCVISEVSLFENVPRYRPQTNNSLHFFSIFFKNSFFVSFAYASCIRNAFASK